MNEVDRPGPEWERTDLRPLDAVGFGAVTLIDAYPRATGYAGDLPCRYDPDLWFADRPADLELAKARCLDCPALRSCLAGAVARAEPWGVWGGEIFSDGVVIARKRPRGRPRKDEGDVAA